MYICDYNRLLVHHIFMYKSLMVTCMYINSPRSSYIYVKRHIFHCKRRQKSALSSFIIYVYVNTQTIFLKFYTHIYHFYIHMHKKFTYMYMKDDSVICMYDTYVCKNSKNVPAQGCLFLSILNARLQESSVSLRTFSHSLSTYTNIYIYPFFLRIYTYVPAKDCLFFLSILNARLYESSVSLRTSSSIFDLVLSLMPLQESCVGYQNHMQESYVGHQNHI